MRFKCGDVNGTVEILHFDAEGRPYGRIYYSVADAYVGCTDRDNVDLFDCMAALRWIAYERRLGTLDENLLSDPGRAFEMFFQSAYGVSSNDTTLGRFNVTTECDPLESKLCFCCDAESYSLFVCALRTPTGYDKSSLEAYRISKGSLDSVIGRMHAYVLGAYDLFALQQE